MSTKVQSNRHRETRVKREVVIRWSLLIGATIIVAATLFLQSPDSALAEAPPARGDSIENNTYKGWGVVQTGSATAGAWKWTPAGWEALTFPPGKTVWLHPWGDGWYWAWTNGSWHAISTDLITRWSCFAGAMPITKAGDTVTLYRYNTNRSAVVGTTAGEITSRCYNPFADAGIDKDRIYTDRPSGYILVDAVIDGANVVGYVPECQLAFIWRNPEC